MHMPPRLGDIRMWATRLHIFGDTAEEEKLLSAANQKIAGLPIPTDVMPAEEQLMLLGIARDNEEASLMVFGPRGERPPPQLYSAPDPEEDPEAERAMEHLASLAGIVYFYHHSISSLSRFLIRIFCIPSSSIFTNYISYYVSATSNFISKWI